MKKPSAPPPRGNTRAPAGAPRNPKAAPVAGPKPIPVGSTTGRRSGNIKGP